MVSLRAISNQGSNIGGKNMPGINELPTSAGRDRKQKSCDSAAYAAAVRIGDRFIFEIDAKSGVVSKCEVIDLGGVRRELSEDEQANLANVRMQDRLEGLLERAFESGIANALGGTDEEDDQQEDEEEEELRRVLLDPLLEKSIVRRLMRRNVLAPAILRTLIQYSVNADSSDKKKSETKAGGS
jgi:hypothetical protein